MIVTVCDCVNWKNSSFHNFPQFPIRSYKDLTLSCSIHFSCVDTTLKLERTWINCRFVTMCNYFVKVHDCFFTCDWVQWWITMNPSCSYLFQRNEKYSTKNDTWFSNHRCKMMSNGLNMIKWRQHASTFIGKPQSYTSIDRILQTSTDTFQQPRIAYNQKATPRTRQDNANSR